MLIEDSLKDRQTAITVPELAKMVTLSRRQLYKMAAAILATERHFTPTQLAALWGMSPSKVRELFSEEEGVIRFGEPSRREGKKLVRSYYSMRIPESVASRVHDSLTSTARRPAKRVPRPDRAPRERSVA
jgi:hypothetical protein